MAALLILKANPSLSFPGGTAPSTLANTTFSPDFLTNFTTVPGTTLFSSVAEQVDECHTLHYGRSTSWANVGWLRSGRGTVAKMTQF
jgi:hypothetical protein